MTDKPSRPTVNIVKPTKPRGMPGEVLAYVDEHPDETDDIVAAEEAGKNRITLLEKLG